ncbi:MAG: hypothetical protein WEC84_05145 [Candidatus Andersenbacteria bacterium]
MKKTTKKKRDVVTIGPKHQVVIPKALRHQYRQFAKGAKVRVYPLDDKTLALRVEDGSWAQENYGVFKDIFADVDVEKELKKLRKEWD